MEDLNQLAEISAGNNLEIEVDLERIDSPALKKILREFNDPDVVTKMYDKHSDWGQQGQCGCVVGCLGG
jgi:hypothetical protein